MVMPYGARMPAQPMPYERGGSNPLAEALSSMAPQIQPPMPQPTGGGGVPWEQLIKLLPMILAGMKGGMPAVGGYASGLAEGERQNQMLGMRRDEMAYGREQDAMQRQRQAAQDERQEREDQYRELERARQQQRDTLEALQGRAGEAMEGAPYHTEVIDGVPVPPELGVQAAVDAAGREMGADPALVARVRGQVPGAMQTRKQRKAAEILGNLKGRDPASYPSRFMEGLTLDDLKTLAPEAAMGLLPERQKPVNQQIKETAGGGYVGIDPRNLKVTPVNGVRAPQPVGASGGVDLSAQGLDAAALLFLKTGQIASLGMGRSAGDDKKRIINRAAELMPNLDIAGNQSGFKADQATLTLLTKRVGATRAFAEQAKGSLNNAAKAAQAMPRTGSPIFNRYKQFVTGKTLTGDPRLTALETFIYSASRDYAKVTSGGAESVAALTDTANAKAEELLNAAQTPEQFTAALTAMQQDMDNAVETLVAERDMTQQKIRQMPGGGDDEAKRGKRAALKDLLRK